MNSTMQQTISDFLNRNAAKFAENFHIDITYDTSDNFTVTAKNGNVYITANNLVMAFHGFYCYLKKYCGVQLSWCGNREIKIKKLTMFDGEYKKYVEQKYRVYMNYCTLDYSMCWWDFKRWEKEIDFMAMNGINMPLAVIGSEAVLYETLLEFGFSKSEALSEISGPAFWAWHLMTNIMGYMPPKDEKYVYERLALGKRILDRYLELGMIPIQQGFSGHVPEAIKEKIPAAILYMQNGWCGFPKTAQVDPLDPFFDLYGKTYLRNLKELMGFYGYVACDPFHEGTPPKKDKEYLNAVGKTISNLYTRFDNNSIWVMQAWSMRKDIVQAVDKDKLLILDINSERTLSSSNMWGYSVVSGMLHNFGGKNAMQGKLKVHAKNPYVKLKNAGANVVGSGLFMEGIDQNPIVYDLQFELLTLNGSIDLNSWLDDYIKRRYGKYNSKIRDTYELLLKTCYKDKGYHENAVGSTLASRPQMRPVMTGPCCYSKVFYNVKTFEKALTLFASVKDEFEDSDGYAYDLCDMTRQALSNRFYVNQKEFAKAYLFRNVKKAEAIAERQRKLLLDVDRVASLRSEMNLERWLFDAHNLASDEEEKRYFDLNARTLITLWGDIRGDAPNIYDYSWREWGGLIKDYYYARWDKFYSEAIVSLKNRKRFKIINGNDWNSRLNCRKYDFGKKLAEFETSWIYDYKEVDMPKDEDVIPTAIKIIEEYGMNK